MMQYSVLVTSSFLKIGMFVNDCCIKNYFIYIHIHIFLYIIAISEERGRELERRQREYM